MKKNKIEKIQNLTVGKKESHILRNILIFLSIAVALALVVFFSYFFISKYSSKKITINTLKEKWNEYDYLGLYEIGKTYTVENPADLKSTGVKETQVLAGILTGEIENSKWSAQQSFMTAQANYLTNIQIK